MRIWSLVADMLDVHGRCALVSVAEVRGSAPREPGARMVIAPDGGFRGTIGGGELEWRAIASAREALSREFPVTSLDRLTLGPDLGQCCGGSVRLLTEVFDRDRLDEVGALAAREAAGPFATRGRVGPQAVDRVVDAVAAREAPDPTRKSHPTDRARVVPHPSSIGAGQAGRSGGRGAGAGAGAGPSFEIAPDGTIIERFRDLHRPVWLFGAGPVGRALMLALAPLPFDVTWSDERADAFPAAVPASVTPLHSTQPAGELSRAPDGAFVAVMTHSHPRDLAIVHAALAAGRFGYVGLIGSASKRARFCRRLREGGVADSTIAELVCPIGLPGIASKHPAAIATGVAAELLERDEALAGGNESVPGARRARGAAAEAIR